MKTIKVKPIKTQQTKAIKGGDAIIITDEIGGFIVEDDLNGF